MAQRRSGKVDAETLRAVPMLAPMDFSELVTLASVATSWRLYDRDQLVFCPGEESGEVFLVLAGTLRAYGLTPADVEVDMLRLSEGAVLNFETLPQRLPDVAHLVAEDSEAVVTRMPPGVFRSTVARCPPSERIFRGHVQAQLLQLATLGLEIALFDPPSRVRHFLGERAEDEPEHMVWESHAAIARRVGARREAVSKLLKPLKRRGLIDYTPYHRGIKVLEIAELRRTRGEEGAVGASRRAK